MQTILLVVAASLGLSIAYVDSRPNWDDTGVTAFALLLTCAIFGALVPDRPWRWALAVGVWVPAAGIVMSGNFGALLALGFAFAGAYGGMGLRNLVSPVRKDTGDRRTGTSPE